METLNIVLITISIMVIIEGLIFVVFPNKIRKAMKEMFKNTRATIKYGLIELLIGLGILFLTFM